MHCAIFGIVRASGLFERDGWHKPSMFPCSQSTNTQSAPDLANSRDTLAPGSICHMPTVCLPSLKAVLILLEACILVFWLRSWSKCCQGFTNIFTNASSQHVLVLLEEVLLILAIANSTFLSVTSNIWNRISLHHHCCRRLEYTMLSKYNNSRNDRRILNPTSLLPTYMR